MQNLIKKKNSVPKNKHNMIFPSQFLTSKTKICKKIIFLREKILTQYNSLLSKTPAISSKQKTPTKSSPLLPCRLVHIFRLHPLRSTANSNRCSLFCFASISRRPGTDWADSERKLKTYLRRLSGNEILKFEIFKKNEFHNFTFWASVNVRKIV